MKSVWSLYAPILRVILISSLLGLANACANKPRVAVPQGWFINGAPLLTAQNQALASGATLYLPEIFTLEAVTDCILRVTQNQQGEIEVDVLYGMAGITHQNAKPNISLQAGVHQFKISGTRLLLQNKMNTVRLAVIEGEVDYRSSGNDNLIVATSDNLLEILGSETKRRTVAPRDLAKIFPEVANVRRLLAAR